MKSIFKSLFDSLEDVSPEFIHSKLTDEQIRKFPDLNYPFTEMIEYVETKYINQEHKKILLEDLKAIQKINQRRMDLTGTDLKLQDAIILALPDIALDGYMMRRKLSEVKLLFNPISDDAKRKINESYKRTHTGN